MASALNVKEPETSERAVIVAGLPVRDFDRQLLTTLLNSHFQDPRGKSGIVEMVTYPTKPKGVAYVTFKENKVAENIARQKKLYLVGKSGCIQVSVFPLTAKVFTSVTAVLNLSAFRRHFSLESLVSELHKKIPGLRFSHLSPSGSINVQGSFLAFKKLKESLLLKTYSLLEENWSLIKESEKCDRQSSEKSLQRSSNRAETLRSLVPKTVPSGETLMLDTDVFLYLRNKDTFYARVLKRSPVLCQETMNGEITTIHLRNTQSGSHLNHAKQVKEYIEKIALTLQFELRKERLVLEGKGSSEKRKISSMCEQLSSKYGRVLINFSRAHVDIIGPSSDIYLFKKDVLKLAGMKTR